MKALWRTTIYIWTEYDPQHLELSELAREAEVGNAYCDYMRFDYIENPVAAGLATEFFDEPDNEDEV